MTDLSPQAPLPQMNLKDMCKRFNIRFKKSLGQNLLLDDNINRIMVDAARLSKEDYVIEVGASLGALTRRICQNAGQVLSIEIDATFMPCLEEQFGTMDHVKLFRGDVLNHSLGKLIDEYIPGGETYKLISNLPYYITTPILFHFLESPLHFERLVTMMQDEVGQRLVAPVGAENYGILSIAARLYADVDVVHKVPASCFVPKPKVDSCIVRFRCKKELTHDIEPKFMMKVVRAAFAQRRKTLRNSLTKSGAFGVPKDIVLEALAAAGINDGRRPQSLDLDDFALLAKEMKSRI